jgi:hypothetical protein
MGTSMGILEQCNPLRLEHLNTFVFLPYVLNRCVGSIFIYNESPV